MNCRIARTLGALSIAAVFGVAVAQTEPESRITIYPKDRPICEDYLKLLNQTPPKEALPVCKNHLEQLPGATPLDWEVLDPLLNLELLYKLEWLLGGQLRPEPPREHSVWLKQFQRRAKNRATLPTIKQARVSIEPDQPQQLVYSYETAGPGCSPEKLAAWKKDSFFGPFIFFHHELAQDPDWVTTWGYPFVYDKRLHFYSSGLSDKTHFVQWAARMVIYTSEKHRPLQSGTGYQRLYVCQFSDTQIFFPPPKQ